MISGQFLAPKRWNFRRIRTGRWSTLGRRSITTSSTTWATASKWPGSPPCAPSRKTPPFATPSAAQAQPAPFPGPWAKLTKGDNKIQNIFILSKLHLHFLHAKYLQGRVFVRMPFGYWQCLFFCLLKGCLFRTGHYGTIGRAIPAPVVPKPGMQVFIIIYKIEIVFFCFEIFIDILNLRI